MAVISEENSSSNPKTTFTNIVAKQKLTQTLQPGNTSIISDEKQSLPQDQSNNSTPALSEDSIKNKWKQITSYPKSKRMKA